ncbi:MAG: DUF4423 domain-containing protein [Proteobacteria bacterium]|nr:MAG: DUF4423 domain-containing protein [Pseudomonadota bacterium]
MRWPRQNRTSHGLTKRFGLPTLVIEKHLEVLTRWSLVERQGNRWSWKSGDLHLAKDSQSVILLHMNWRQQAIQSAATGRADATHYSVVQSLSREDFEKLRYKVLDWIKTFQQVSTPSKPEDLVCFNLDFFVVGNGSQ